MEIAKRLKQVRLEKNISQSELAKAIDVDVSSISYWESGRYEPKATYIFKLSKELQVSTDFLLRLEDESGAKYVNSFNGAKFHNNGNGNITIK